MEALAIRDGVKLACYLGLSRIEVESDPSEVVKLLETRAQGKSEITTVLQEIEDLTTNLGYFQQKFS
jgi:hypothetical protein